MVINMITRLEVKGNTLTIHKKTERKVYEKVADLYKHNQELKTWLQEKDIVDIAYIGSGYAYGRNINGMWYNIDITNKIIQKQPISTKTKLPNSYIQGLAVSEQDWGKWATELPVRRTKTFA